MTVRPCGSLLIVLALGLTVSFCREREDPLAALREAASKVPRLFAGRLCGYAWTPRGKHKDKSLDLRGAAGAVVAIAERASTAEALHHAGVARLLIGEPEAAIEALSRSLKLKPLNARAWNDLSVAIHATGSPEHLPRALAAADKARQLDPYLREASFNRAIILRTLGFLDAAEKQAASYRLLDAASEWAVELDTFQSPRRLLPPNEFRAALNVAFDLRRRGNTEPLRQLVRTQPRDARAWAESPLLAEWAKAFLGGDMALARMHLDNVRALAELTMVQNGECLATDTVRHLETLTGTALRSAAIAIRRYDSARLSLHQGRSSDAQHDLRRTQTAFRRLGSPMALVASYYAATAGFVRNDVDSARAELYALSRSVDRRRNPAHAAQIDWQLGLAEAYGGDWNAALANLERSRVAFNRMGEILNSAFVAAIIAEFHDRLGEYDVGWRIRVDALADLSRTDVFGRIVAVTAGAIRAEISREEYEGALALTAVIGSTTPPLTDAPMHTLMLTHRAHVLLLAHKPADAINAIREARQLSSSIHDPDERALADANIGVVEGSIMRLHAPKRAVDLISRSIAYYERHRSQIFSSHAYVERARAAAAAGDPEMARSDFLLAVAEQERQRQGVVTDRFLPVFQITTNIVAELLEMELGARCAKCAFAAVERLRSHGVARVPGRQEWEPNSFGRAVQAALPQRSALIEYVILPGRLLIFIVGSQGLDTVSVDISEADLKTLATRWTDAARSEFSGERTHAAAMFDRLIRPALARLKDVDVIFVVPDRFLFGVPLAALYDRLKQRRLIEDYRLILTPSATLIGTSPTVLTGRGLVVGDPTTAADPDGLLFARQEAEAVARIHGLPPPLVGDAATVAAFAAEAPRANWIHYAGHARSTSWAEPWLALAAAPLDRPGLTAGEISRMDLRQTRLVVLAACSTLSGRADRIEGMPSLSAAFLAAGAKSVVGTLWDVDDRRASRFFRMLHEHLSAGLPLSVALQRVQCTFLRAEDPTMRAPASWAGVQQLGGN